MLRALVALLLASPAFAESTFVNPAGDDANDCLTAWTPCKTLQAAANKAGSVGHVSIADGTYYGGTHVLYHRMVNFTGNCLTPGAVVISSPGAAAFTAQDHAILTAQCLDVVGDAGSIGFYSRQFAIIDAFHVRFGAMNVHVIANEKSKINLQHETILGGASYHIMASGQSMVIEGGPVSIGSGVGFYAWAWTGLQSLIMAGGATISGSATGHRYINDSSSVITQPPGGFPGNQPGQCEPGCIVK